MNDLEESGNITRGASDEGWKQYIILQSWHNSAVWMLNVLKVYTFQINQEGQKPKIKWTLKYKYITVCCWPEWNWNFQPCFPFVQKTFIFKYQVMKKEILK